MFIDLKLGWRNIWRNPRRTLLTLLAVSMTSAILVFFIALQLSSYDASINATVSIYQGHIQIQKKGYLDKPQIRTTILDPAIIKEKIKQIQNIKVSSIRAVGFALVSSELRSYGAQVVGVETDSEPLVSTIPGLLIIGKFFSSNSSNEAVIGATLAKNLKVSVGHEITLLGQGSDGSMAATVLSVVGIFESGVSEIDRNMIEIPISVFQDVFSMNSMANTIVVVVDNINNVAMVQKDLRALFNNEKYPDLVALRWDELIPGIKQAIELDMAGGWLFYFSLVVIVCFSILNTFLMSVMERTREFGIMLSLGNTPKNISLLVFLECTILTIVGLLLGVLFGSLVVYYYHQFGFSVPGGEEILKKWNLPSKIYPMLSLKAIYSGPVVILFSSLIAVIYPAIRIFWIEPTEALRAN